MSWPKSSLRQSSIQNTHTCTLIHTHTQTHPPTNPHTYNLPIQTYSHTHRTLPGQTEPVTEHVPRWSCPSRPAFCAWRAGTGAAATYTPPPPPPPQQKSPGGGGGGGRDLPNHCFLFVFCFFCFVFLTLPSTSLWGV